MQLLHTTAGAGREEVGKGTGAVRTRYRLRSVKGERLRGKWLFGKYLGGSFAGAAGRGGRRGRNGGVCEEKRVHVS